MRGAGLSAPIPEIRSWNRSLEDIIARTGDGPTAVIAEAFTSTQPVVGGAHEYEREDNETVGCSDRTREAEACSLMGSDDVPVRIRRHIHDVPIQDARGPERREAFRLSPVS